MTISCVRRVTTVCSAASGWGCVTPTCTPSWWRWRKNGRRAGWGGMPRAAALGWALSCGGGRPGGGGRLCGRDPACGDLVHDDLLLSAALCAVLDTQPWGSISPALVVPGRDPLQDLDTGF